MTETTNDPNLQHGVDDAVNYAELGFVRVAAVAPEITLADPLANAEQIISHIRTLSDQHVSIALFPELAVTGYSCEDLFFNQDLQQANIAALKRIAAASTELVCVVGAPYLLDDGRLLDCAVIAAGGAIQAMIPKIALPNYGEFYERRWFVAGDSIDLVVNDDELGEFRIATNQLLRVGGFRFAVEVCEDLWSPEPPGTRHSLAGAELILNVSASNELVAKADYRRDLVYMASARGICGYVYASSGPTESSKDVVFGGHLIACENGQPIGESERYRLAATTLIVDLDIDKLRHDRMQNTTFTNAPRPPAYHLVDVMAASQPIPRLARKFPRHPFVPSDEAQFDARAQEILNIQTTGLARRMLAAHTQTLVIGLSGGLDSTLAFLVCLDALTKLDLPRQMIHALTLPGPGTTSHTLESARRLCANSGVELTEIPINAAVDQHLADLKHSERDDVVFENAQARERTQILFNYANKVSGIVVGTGDLSELALGWCTYNADHMASYNVNASVPKTLMSYLVRWYAAHRADAALASVLERVLDTPISPELIAPDPDGAISQETEAIIGPYELHDFFLYHFLRNGSTATKIYRLAQGSFTGSYTDAELKRWLRMFYQRFFSQQFKRTTLPPGPKVGSVSLSPRGDWRMPDEASVQRILTTIDNLPENLPENIEQGS
jgi:NAD+ synthase (glutamine-hydrolysing)